jgi:hypothetical protein
MLVAVDFDDQLCLQTTEIDDVRADRDLAAKVRPVRWKTVAQVPPELLFGFGGAMTQ